MYEELFAALENNNMQPFYAESKSDALKIAAGLIPKGATVASGGSVTLVECGILRLVRGGEYNYLDRYAPGLDAAGREEIFRKSNSADWYLSGTNAITQGGVLYNVDGNSNRVSALAYGPKNVLIVVGRNKLVKDLDAAVRRVREYAAPLNAKRLNCETYCAKTGRCVALDRPGAQYADGCDSPGRICCNYLISAHQRQKNRIKIILVDEELGL